MGSTPWCLYKYKFFYQKEETKVALSFIDMYTIYKLFLGKKIAYNTTMFVLAEVKKLAQKIGRSNSGFGNRAKSNTCIHILKTEIRTKKGKQAVKEIN